jgi:hypothetical protein
MGFTVIKIEKKQHIPHKIYGADEIGFYRQCTVSILGLSFRLQSPYILEEFRKKIVM